MLNLNKVKPKIEEIARKYNLNFMVIFGSRASGLVHKKSDVDLLVELPKKASLLDFIGLKLELEERLARKVDLVEYEALHPLLKERILAEQISIYGKKRF